jgi:hypothetical protein
MMTLQRATPLAFCAWSGIPPTDNIDALNQCQLMQRQRMKRRQRLGEKASLLKSAPLTLTRC